MHARRLVRTGWVLGVAVLAACPPVEVSLPAPLDRFYFPSALAHVDARDGGDGVLLVASANFDKRFATGALVAVNLDALPTPLPPFGSTPPSAVQVEALRGPEASPDDDAVRIAPFAGQMRVWPLGDGRFRAFVATRSEFQRVHAVDLELGVRGVARLSCFGGDGGRDCGESAPSLTQYEQTTPTGLPRAPGAFGVALRERTCVVNADCGAPEVAYSCRAGRCVTSRGGREEPAADVLVTHIAQADSPLGSQTNQRGYLVRLASEDLTLSPERFIELGPGATHAVAVGARWNFVSGRFLNPEANLVRLVDLSSGQFLSSGLETSFRVAEARGIALSEDERRVFLIGRNPDALLVASVDDPTGPSPRLRVVRGNPLPAGPNEVAVLPRAGRGALLAITCTTAGVLALYDDEVGEVAAEVPGVGVQPFGLAVDLRGAGARLYVSNFQDGRVAVIDVVDLDAPRTARLVAHLGRQQLCLVRPSDPSCAPDGGASP
ncbi:MAG: hypothetical protein INH41_03610 [Myxococcaceae bacterium]|nr:hypothetical protein [Myxococcaceae bacterium]